MSSTRRAAILAIGDELTLGQKADTNSAWIAERLATCAVVTEEHRTVGDDRDAIAVAIGELARGRDLLLITGGLGPTADDLTRLALGDVLTPGKPLVVDEAVRDALVTRWRSRHGRRPPACNLVQAERPESMGCVENPHGTAPGLDGRLEGCRILAMPGPPHEMRPMLEREVIARHDAADHGQRILIENVNAYGLGESEAAERLGSILDRGRNPLVGITVSDAILTVRIRGTGTADEVPALVEGTTIEVERRLTPYVYGRGDPSLAAAVGAELELRGLTLTTAESCTGGWLAKRLVDVAGSSAYFAGGWVTYSDAMKSASLDVGERVLAEHGAVSAETAVELAVGAARAADADVAVSTTGIAGPTGGTADKPVGTVFIAVARGDDDPLVRRFRFAGDRSMVRDRTVKAALQMVRLAVREQEIPPLIWEVPAGAPRGAVS